MHWHRCASLGPKRLGGIRDRAILLLGCGLCDGEQDLAGNRCAGGKPRLPSFPSVAWVPFELPIAVRAVLFTRVRNSFVVISAVLPHRFVPRKQVVPRCIVVGAS